jgi:glutathione synthase/RimK-type ligase-like ATP-grasp enzyme
LVKTVIVLGNAAVGAPAPPPIAAACRRLAEMSGADLLGVDFIEGPLNAWTFAGANPMPYLTLGGAALIDALCERLAVTRRAS